MVAEAKIGRGDQVWEIGPGKGILTRELLKAGADITAFELDRRLIPHLNQEFGDSIDLRHQDILTLDWEAELARQDGILKMVANIPYQITSPLLYMLERHADRFSRIVIMVQKEVAQRLCARPGTKAYGVMTLRLKRLFDIENLFGVGRESFEPVPGVDSMAIALSPRRQPPLIKDSAKYLQLISAAFSHRRKTLRNNLLSLVDRNRIASLEHNSGIDLSRRGETLSEEEFILLGDLL